MFKCICGVELKHDDIKYPVHCICGRKYKSQTEFTQLTPMSVENYLALQKKLGLSAFGIPQNTLPPLQLPKPDKPSDLPEEVIQWLNQYEDRAQLSDKH